MTRTERKFFRDAIALTSETQRMVQRIGERMTRIEQRLGVLEAPAAYWFVARVRGNVLQLAGWTSKRVVWLADPQRATGFSVPQGAREAIKGLRRRRGTTYTTVRMFV